MSELNYNATRKYVIDEITDIDETDCQTIVKIHDLQNPENQFDICAWIHDIPELKVGATVEGILSIEYVCEPKKCDGPLLYRQNGIDINAVVEVLCVLNRDGDVLAKTGSNSISVVVEPEQKVKFAKSDRIDVEGELWLRDTDHIKDLCCWN